MDSMPLFAANGGFASCIDKHLRHDHVLHPNGYSSAEHRVRNNMHWLDGIQMSFVVGERDPRVHGGDLLHDGRPLSGNEIAG